MPDSTDKPTAIAYTVGDDDGIRWHEVADTKAELEAVWGIELDRGMVDIYAIYVTRVAA